MLFYPLRIFCWSIGTRYPSLVWRVSLVCRFCVSTETLVVLTTDSWPCGFRCRPDSNVDIFGLQRSSRQSPPCLLSTGLLHSVLTPFGCALNTQCHRSCLSILGGRSRHLIVPTTSSFTPSVCRGIPGMRPVRTQGAARRPDSWGQLCSWGPIRRPLPTCFPPHPPF